MPAEAEGAAAAELKCLPDLLYALQSRPNVNVS